MRKCEACQGYYPDLIPCRGHLLCPACIHTWETYHPEWTWEKFLRGDESPKVKERQERRERVVELSKQDKTEMDIAAILHVSLPTIYSDLAKAREKGKIV